MRRPGRVAAIAQLVERQVVVLDVTGSSPVGRPTLPFPRSASPAGCARTERGNVPMQLRLDGRAALITGGSKGLGLAIAKAFAGAGGQVAIVARHAEQLGKAEAEIKAAAPEAKVAAVAADISTAAGCEAAFA